MSAEEIESQYMKSEISKEYSLIGQGEESKDLASLKRLRIEGFNTKINECIEGLDQESLVDLVKNLRLSFPLVDKKIKDKLTQYQERPSTIYGTPAKNPLSNPARIEPKTEPPRADPQRLALGPSNDCEVLEQKLAIQKQRFNTIVSELMAVENYFKGQATIDRPLKTITLKTIYNSHVKMMADKDDAMARLMADVDRRDRCEDVCVDGRRRGENGNGRLGGEDLVEIDELRHEKERAFEEIVLLKGELERSKNESERIKVELQQYSKRFKDQVEADQLKIEDLIKAKSKLTQQLQDSTNQSEKFISLHENSISALKSDIDQSKARSECLISQITELNSKLNDKENEIILLQNMKTEHRDKNTLLQNDLFKQISELENNLTSGRDSHAESINRLEQEFKISQEKLETLRSMNKKLKDELTNLKALTKDQSNQIINLESQVSESQNQSNTHQTTQTDPKAQDHHDPHGLSSLQATHASLQVDHARLADSLSLSTRRCVDLTDQMAMYDCELSAARLVECRLTADLCRVQSAVDVVTAARDECEARLTVGRERIGVLEREVEEGVGVVEKAREFGESMQGKVRDLEEVIKKDRDENEKALLRIDDMSNKLNSIESQYALFKENHQTCQPETIKCLLCPKLQDALINSKAQLASLSDDKNRLFGDLNMAISKISSLESRIVEMKALTHSHESVTARYHEVEASLADAKCEIDAYGRLVMEIKRALDCQDNDDAHIVEVMIG